MQYRTLGSTGIRVSAVSLGTVSLGVDYGIDVPGGFGRPQESEAVDLLIEAAECGITLFDTAPAYGDSERLLGIAFGDRPECVIATKVSVPVDSSGERVRGTALRDSIMSSLEESLHRLHRDSLDVVQIHNATSDILREGEITEVLEDARDEGLVRHVGATIYTEGEALTAIEAGAIQVLQVPYSLIDRRMEARVLVAAERAGVGVLSRSTLLKGMLTPKVQWAPKELHKLRDAAEGIRRALQCSWDELPQEALRFSLSAASISSVLIGARTADELRVALDAEREGPLPDECIEATRPFVLSDERLVNPSHWDVR